MRSVIAFFKLFLFVLNCLWVVPIQSLTMLFTKGAASYILPRYWHSIVCAVFRVKIIVEGTPSRDKQTLYMSNHISYIDICVIGSILRASFVAKSEVEGWPLFGYLSTLQQTAFIQRKREAIADQKATLQGRIESGESLIIFPEGTSTDGRDVIPFKTSLFSLAYLDTIDEIHVQPITLQIISVDGRSPQNQDDLDLYAWHRDMDTELDAHLWRFAKSKGAVIKLTFHDPLKNKAYENRKTLAKACHEAVSNGLDRNIIEKFST